MSSSFSPQMLDDQASALAENLTKTRRRIETAALRYSRPSGSVSLLAVSKLQGVDRIRAAYAAGQTEFGENYLQEAIAKITQLGDLNVIWHFIGQIQSNKTRLVAEHFSWVHTVDRLKIADRLNEQRPLTLPPLNICIQVKVEDEKAKGGVDPSEVLPLARSVASLARLKLRGLMCIPPPKESFEAQIGYFRRVAQLFEQLRSAGIAVDTLSMGMSGDLEAAIAAGATIVRVGTGIFGERMSRDERQETSQNSG